MTSTLIPRSKRNYPKAQRACKSPFPGNPIVPLTPFITHNTMIKPITPILSATLALLACAQARGQAFHLNDLTPAGATAATLSASASGLYAGQASYVTNGLGHNFALLLSNDPLAPIDLQPADPIWSQTMVTSTDGLQQGGWGAMGFGWTHALLWSGSASSVVDLHQGANLPSNGSSYCLGVHSGEQVGYANGDQALLWRGTPASLVYLHPFSVQPGARNISRALGVHNGEQVGYVSQFREGTFATPGRHAVIWHGTPESELDIHPAGYLESAASVTIGSQQGGWASVVNPDLVTGTAHATLWSGDAASAIDLHPAGYDASWVVAMNAAQQVGMGITSLPAGDTLLSHRRNRALLWSGAAETVVELESFLPAGYTNLVVSGIDDEGRIVGTASRDGNNYNTDAAGGPWKVAVVLIPGSRPAGQIASLSLDTAQTAPGTSVQGTLTLSSPAPAGGLLVNFASSRPDLATAPSPLVIPEGDINASFTWSTDGAALTRPQSLKLYAMDGTVAPSATLALVPVVTLNGLSSITVEGGFSASARVSIDLPAPYPGAAIALSSGDPLLVTVPATVTIPFSYGVLGAPTSQTFTLTTQPVTSTTVVPVTATFNGSTVTGTVTLTPAPAITIVGVTAPEVVGGYVMPITITVNNFPRPAAGAVITLTSSDPVTLQAPATATIASGAFSTTINATTIIVSKRKAVTLTATYNGSSVTTTVFVSPIPTVTIGHADYFTDTHEFKVDATTSFPNAVMTFGTSPSATPLGTLVNEAGVFKGSIVLSTAPSQATVWNSFGGQATVSVRLRTSVVAGGGTGTPSYKLSLSTNGKGTVTTSPSGTSFTVGTVVTLTATPAAGSPWMGWSGDATGVANPLTFTITKDTKITANFR